MTKILLVEDDKSLREIYGVRLIAEGYSVVSAEDGEKALAVAIGERPDLIISDVMMPKISGFEMLDLLRGNESTKNVRVIMLTALSSEQQRERGERLGADRYLVKSQVGIEDIVRTVHEVLNDQQGVRTLSQIEESARAATAAQKNATSATQAHNQAGYAAPQTANAVPNSAVIVSQGGYPMPAAGQSAYNPLAATAPASAAGQPAPEMPAQPMHIPTYSSMPSAQMASYNAAMQAAVAAAEKLNAFSNPNAANLNNQPQIATDGANTNRAAQSPTNIEAQSISSGSSTFQLPQIPTPPISQPAATTKQANTPALVQNSPSPNPASPFMQAPTANNANTDNRAISNYQPNVPLGERVIQPPVNNSELSSPKIDINSLLNDASTPSNNTPLFPAG